MSLVSKLRNASGALLASLALSGCEHGSPIHDWKAGDIYTAGLPKFLEVGAGVAASKGNTGAAAGLAMSSGAAQNLYNRDTAMDAAGTVRNGDNVTINYIENNSNLKLPPEVSVMPTTIEQMVERDGEFGILITYEVNVKRGFGKTIEMYTGFFGAKAETLKDKDGKFRSIEGNVMARGPDINPVYDVYKESSTVFLPYSQLDQNPLPDSFYFIIGGFERLPNGKFLRLEPSMSYLKHIDIAPRARNLPNKPNSNSVVSSSNP